METITLLDLENKIVNQKALIDQCKKNGLNDQCLDYASLVLQTLEETKKNMEFSEKYLNVSTTDKDKIVNDLNDAQNIIDAISERVSQKHVQMLYEARDLLNEVMCAIE